MFLETIRSPGLAHLSYLIGDGDSAAVVDPRWDVDVYEDKAREHGARITWIFETHRNEDLVSGARALGDAAGATVLHGTALDFRFGEGAEDGRQVELGDLRLRVLHTPGHTDESISIAAFDAGYGDSAVGVFTGDALFVGDVGRTDFHPERADEDAGRLYDSIHEKLLPLGDQALIYPAHGSGSVCGDDMASREFSSLGHERRHNLRLQLDRDAFVRAKVAERHVQPPYFRAMERRNREGAEPLLGVPRPRARGPAEVEAAVGDGAQLVDVRSAAAHAGSAVPGSLALPIGLLSAYAGWFLSYDAPIVLIAEDERGVSEAAERLARLGFVDVEAFLAGGAHAWATSGRDVRSIPGWSARELLDARARGDRLTVLDVRKESEWREGHLPGSTHAFLGDLRRRDGLDELPRPIVAFCSTGQRSVVAASILRERGLDDVATCFGSMDACEALGCELEEGA